MRPPTLCSLDGLEPLLVLVARGERLPQLLGAFHDSPYAMLPHEIGVAANRGLNARDRPHYVNEQYRTIMHATRRRLFPPRDA